MRQLKKLLIICTITGITSFLSVLARAENSKRAKITYRANKLEGSGKEGDENAYRQLIGNVVFKHESFTIYADSMQYFDKKGLVSARGNLKLIDCEGGTMVAGHVLYDVSNKIARLTEAVSYVRDTLGFYTEELEYEVENKIGYFHKGAKMIQNKDELVSKTGAYDQKNNLATFGGAVSLINEDYHLLCDSLLYYTNTQLAEFYGPTQIVTQGKEKATISTQIGGKYNTETQYALFKEATIDSEKYSFYANLIEAIAEKKYYTMSGKARFTSKEYHTTLMGDSSYYQAEQGIAEIYGNPLLERIVDNDTLYLLADTLRAIEDKKDTTAAAKNHIILAYNNVKLYNQSLQGIADSMAYHSIDSTIHLYNHPTFWSYDTQLTAEEASIVLNKDQLEKMHMFPGAFIAAEDTLGNYNQVKGRELVAQFKDNKIDYIDILGNGETLYFAIDDMELIGMNYVQCSHMRLEMEGEGEKKEGLKSIIFFVKPGGTFYPKQKIVDSERLLSEFSWKITEKPSLDLFLKRRYDRAAHQID